MSSHAALARFESYAVPVVLTCIVVVTALVVPPLVLGEMTVRTYAISAAVIILASSSVLPYALLVGLGTLPLLYAETASFGAPETAADGSHSFSGVTALRHVVAGISYVLAAAVVGAIGIGTQFAVGGDAARIPAAVQPAMMYLGGVVIAAAFVSLQLWRYQRPVKRLPRRTILGTATLGALVALSPAVAYWVFTGAI